MSSIEKPENTISCPQLQLLESIIIACGIYYDSLQNTLRMFPGKRTKYLFPCACEQVQICQQSRKYKMPFCFSLCLHHTRAALTSMTELGFGVFALYWVKDSLDF
jgi:hypothetical protein